MGVNVPRATAVYNETDEALSISQVTASSRRVASDARCGHRASTCGKRSRHAALCNPREWLDVGRRLRRRVRGRIAQDESRQMLGQHVRDRECRVVERFVRGTVEFEHEESSAQQGMR
eukprot:5740707-Pleurochrysis_carterae.AAC.1